MHNFAGNPRYEQGLEDYVPGTDSGFALTDYDPTADAAWHLEARIKLARYAEIMCTTFVRQHDAIQPDAYHEAEARLNQLEIDIQLHDTQGTDHGHQYGYSRIG